MPLRSSSRQLKLRSLLQLELMRRCEKNPRYSLRAFAKALGMSHTNLSLIMSGKRQISRQIFNRIVTVLELDLGEHTAVIENADAPLFDEMSVDHQAFCSEWYHAAILSLLESGRTGASPKSIARQLGIQEIQARTSLERLKRLGLISNRNGKWSRDKFSKMLESAIPQRFPKKFFQELLGKASYALENTQDERRSFTATIAAIDPQLLPMLIKMIEQFQEAVREKTGAARNPDEVYALSVQLFPLTSGTPEKS